MTLKIKKTLKIIIPLLFGGGLVWYLFTIIPPKTLLEYFKNANYWWIALGLCFGILSHLSRAYRWKFMLEPLGYNPRFINSTLAVLIGYFVNLAIPRAGEVSRASVMTNYENIPFEKGFGTIVAERIADLFMMFLIIGITLLIQFDFIIELLTKNVDPVKIGVLLVLCIGFGFLFYAYVRKSKKGLGLKIKNFVKSLIEGVTSIFRMKNKYFWIFINLTALKINFSIFLTFSGGPCVRFFYHFIFLIRYPIINITDFYMIGRTIVLFNISPNSKSECCEDFIGNKFYISLRI